MFLLFLFILALSFFVAIPHAMPKEKILWKITIVTIFFTLFAGK